MWLTKRSDYSYVTLTHPLAHCSSISYSCRMSLLWAPQALHMATFRAGSSSQAVPLSATLSFPSPWPSLMGTLSVLFSKLLVVLEKFTFSRTNGISFGNLQHAIVCDHSLMSSSPTKLWFLFGQGPCLFCLLCYFLMAQAHHSLSVKPWCMNKWFHDTPYFINRISEVTAAQDIIIQISILDRATFLLHHVHKNILINFDYLNSCISPL